MVSYFAVSGANLVSESTNPPLSLSKTALSSVSISIRCRPRNQHSPIVRRRHLGGRLHQCPWQCGQSTKTNIFVAPFTTCHTRLKLYEFLDTLQEQVLYYDTDSVVYKWRPDQPSIASGGFLGDMTDELDGDVITEFVSGALRTMGTRHGRVNWCVRSEDSPWMFAAQLSWIYKTMKDTNFGWIGEPTGSSPYRQCGSALLFSERFGTKTHQTVWSRLWQTCH